MNCAGLLGLAALGMVGRAALLVGLLQLRYVSPARRCDPMEHQHTHRQCMAATVGWCAYKQPSSAFYSTDNVKNYITECKKAKESKTK